MTLPQRDPYPVEVLEYLAQAQERYWWHTSRNQILVWVLERWCKEVNRLLEVGCGNGFVLGALEKAYPNAELIGAEFMEDSLAVARARLPQAKFIRLDVCAMDATEAYDVIGAFDVLEHIEDDEKALANLQRALRRGGHLLITVPQHRWLWSAIDERVCHVRRYSRSELVGKVERAGLTVEYVTSFVSLLLPLMWLSRRRSQSEDAWKRELEIHPLLNAALKAVMQLELALLKANVRFPVGGSLLVLAAKPA